MRLEIVVLAAGRGTRMKYRLPKVLHPLAGRPLLEHVLQTARQLEPARIHVVVGYGASDVKQVFRECDDICWVHQAEQKGTGHAMQQALSGIEDSAVVLVLFGDCPLVSLMTLRATLAELKTINASDSELPKGLVLVSANVSNPSGLGRILRDNRDKPLAIVEDRDATPAQRQIHEINSGIMALPKFLLNDYLVQLKAHNTQNEFYLTDVVAMAVADELDIRIHNCPDELEVAGVNDRVQLSKLERVVQHRCAENLMLSGVTLLDPSRIDVRGDVVAGMDCIFDANVVLEGKVTLGERVKLESGVCIRDAEIGDDVVVHPNTVIEGAKIGSRCELGPFARLRPGSELENEVKLGNFVETKKSHIGKGTKASHLSYLGDTTIGGGSNIGAGTIVCNYDGKEKHQTIIGDDVFIGSNATLVAPLRIGNRGFIAAGSTVTVEVAEAELAIGRGKQKNIKGWLPPSERNNESKKDAEE